MPSLRQTVKSGLVSKTERCDWHEVDPVLSGTCDYLTALHHGDITADQVDETWDLFYESHRSLIQHMVWRHRLPPEAAEDCIQEVWLEVVKHLPRLKRRRTASFIAWLASVVRSKVARYRRRESVRATLPLEETAVSRPEPDTHSVTSEEIEAAFSWLREQTTPVNYRIVLMRFLDGRSVADVAAELKMSNEQIRYRQYRTAKKLRAILRAMLE